MIKIAMIGAGSVVFSRNLTGDILSFPEFRDATFSYMDVDEQRLRVGAGLCRRVARFLGATPTIETTTDRRRALDGADFVINMVQIGGFDSTLVDFEIPRRYGLNFTIADTTGPGGIMRALRTFPMLSGLCRDMLDLCPRAWLLNYSNPMSMNMQTITRAHPGVRAIGLCHSVQGTLAEMMSYLHLDPASVAFECAGINHMAFYLRLEKDGQDLYPRLFEVMNDLQVYDSNRVRFEVMKRLGYFVTESSEHNAEYSPWFIPHGREAIARYAVPIDEYLRRCDSIVEQFDGLTRQADVDEPLPHCRTHEYGSAIIHSMVSGTPRVVYGNMPNRGAISNLPNDAIVEAPTMVDRAGCRFAQVGTLPPQLLAYMTPHVHQHELFIRAAMEGRRDYVYQAMLFDPLTAAVLSPDRIVEMCDALISAHGFQRDGGVLPELDAQKTLVPGSGKHFAPLQSGELRARWDASVRAMDQNAIAEWQVIGPFASAAERAVTLSQETSVDADLKARGDGSIDLSKEHRDGREARPWRRAIAARRGFVDCAHLLGARDYCLAYGYAELRRDRATAATLHVGSDDGIAIWLNGTCVHRNDARRPFRAGSDAVPVNLVEGVNRIVVKLAQATGGWGWGISVNCDLG